MIEQTTKFARSKTSLIFWAASAIAVALSAGLLSGRYLERSRPMTPGAKLQIALQAFRSGYDETALSILTPLADEGNAKAQYWLADICEYDPGGKPETAKALTLLGKSTEQRQIGHIFAPGLSVTQDRAQAYGWYENAALRGDGLAERMRDDILKRMSPAEINKGEQIAAGIKPATL